MKKLLLSGFLFLFLNSFTYSQAYVVQIAAFDQKVPLSYFNEALSGIYHFEDFNNIHKYYIGGFKDKASADAKASEAKNLGYNARVIDMEDVRNTCSATCGAPAIPDPTKIRSIFFDFDRSNLRAESKRQLNQLREILNQNASYQVELSAHTDSKGSLEYNTALSMRRANAAKDYLIARGISADRIKVSTFGENAPIAKNEVNGQDTEQGRQFNRRVELIVLGADGKPLGVVEKINVPDSLKE